MKAAVIGLGAMGAPMARNLHRAGLLQTVWNRSPERAQQFQQDTGVPPAASLPELAAQSECIITCVSADEDLREVINTPQPHQHRDPNTIDTYTVAITTVPGLGTLL